MHQLHVEALATWCSTSAAQAGVKLQWHLHRTDQLMPERYPLIAIAAVELRIPRISGSLPHPDSLPDCCLQAAC